MIISLEYESFKLLGYAQEKTGKHRAKRFHFPPSAIGLLPGVFPAGSIVASNRT
jgi:hypothetical protein